VSDTVEDLGKVQCVHDNIVVGLTEAGVGIEEMNKSYALGCKYAYFVVCSKSMQ